MSDDSCYRSTSWGGAAMGMSRQTAFTLMLLLVFSVIVPGSAGYLSVKMEAIGQAHQELLTLENRIRHEKLAARIKRMERVHRPGVSSRSPPPAASPQSPSGAPGSSWGHRRSNAGAGSRSTGSGSPARGPCPPRRTRSAAARVRAPASPSKRVSSPSSLRPRPGRTDGSDSHGSDAWPRPRSPGHRSDRGGTPA